jgi:hypothetical protein
VGLGLEIWQSDILRHGRRRPSTMNYQSGSQEETILVDLNEAWKSGPYTELSNGISLPGVKHAISLEASSQPRVIANKGQSLTIPETPFHSSLLVAWVGNLPTLRPVTGHFPPVMPSTMTFHEAQTLPRGS